MSIVPGQSMQVPAGLSVSPAMKKRVPRNPVHTFNVYHRPFEIQPFMIAPVLAGETVENLLLQARGVTAPIVDSITGWWLEHYFFYCPLRALAATQSGGSETGSASGRTTIENMLLDIAAPVAADNTNRPWAYSDTGGTGKNWVAECMEAIVTNFFRDEGEAYDGSYFSFGSGEPPIAKTAGNGLTDSVYDATTLGDTIIDQTPTADISMEDLDGKYTMWQILRSQKMTELTFEDYLETFGVRQNKKEGPRVELLRQVKSWQYPSSTVNPVNLYVPGDPDPVQVAEAGSVSSVVSFGVSERADKARFIKEPGFIVGVTIARPKLYLASQKLPGASMLVGALDWLPAVLKERVELSVRKFAETAGPLPNASWPGNAYVLDVRDLYLYGDQFITHQAESGILRPTFTPDISAGGNINSRLSYPTLADVNQLFVSEDANMGVHQDGVVHMRVMGTQMDHT